VAGVFSDIDFSPNLFAQARAAAARQRDLIDLSSTNPTREGLMFPADILLPPITDYLQQRRFTPDAHGLPAARAAVVAYYAARSPALALEPDDIYLTASTSEAYALLFALLADPGDNLLVPQVSYPLFEHLAALRGLELRTYQLDAARGWRIDSRSLRAAADERSRAVLIVSPHNPTGAVIRTAHPALAMLGLPIICDEVFAPFTAAEHAVPPLAAFHPQLPVFTLNGISKLFALPDLKLGWIAANPAARPFRDRLELLNDTLLGANGLSQALLPTLFTAGMPFVAAMNARVQDNIRHAVARCAGHPRLQLAAPDGGYLLFPRLSPPIDEDQLLLELLDAGVVVHPGYFYGVTDDPHLMLSALPPPARFQSGLERLLTVLDRHDSAPPAHSCSG
jgi:alanine-synthesizing transaminase